MTFEHCGRDITHFVERCRERGIVETEPVELYERLLNSISGGCTDRFAEHVKNTDRGVFYRFHLPEGIFYTVTRHGDSFPRTIYTQQQMRRVKRAHKFKRKMRSHTHGKRPSTHSR